jgi:diketogulonate reductase-like aldo/keto reductase
MTTKTTPPTLRLKNGVAMPVLGLGVFQSPPEETTAAVETAIADGYRLIDTAASYDNEREVGAAIRASGVDRTEIFVTTKLWISDYGYDEALVGFEGCLRRLGLDYIDLFLLHQPVPTDFDATVGAYKAMEKFLVEGRARTIGVSNFSEKHLEHLMRRTEVVPAVNQVELHPFFTQQTLRDFHSRHGIVTEAWSPLGGIQRYRPADPNAVLNALEHPTVTAIAVKHAKTPAQVVLRWHTQQGLIPVPKSSNAERLAQNLAVFDFDLTASEMQALSGLDRGGGVDADRMGH